MALVFLCSNLSAQETESDENVKASPFEISFREWDEKIPVKTTGGLVFWGDVLFYRDYHIQKGVRRGNYRLLDGQSIQRAFGTFAECEERLNEIIAEDGLLPMSGRVVFLLHGFGANALMMRHLGQWLRETGDYDYVCCVTYPSTMQPLLEHATMLDSIIKRLPPTVNKIDFVGHSFGCIVIRRYLSGPLDKDWRAPADPLAARKDYTPDKRIGRLVMLGPPNHGAEIATKLIGKNVINRAITGASGDELGTQWKETVKSLGIPACSFGVISGGKGAERGYSFLIEGDNDGIVSTEGTKLDGMDDWLFFKLGHGALLMTDEVFQATHQFLQTGTFQKER